MKDYEEIEMIDILKAIWKEKIVIILIMIMAVLLGGIYTTALIEPKYKSETRIIIDRTDISIENMLEATDIINNVAEQLNINSYIIKKSINSTFDKNTKTIEIKVVNTNAEMAYNITNKYTEVLKLKLEEMYKVKSYSIIEFPTLATQPYNINHVKDMAIAVVAGMIISLLYIIAYITSKGITQDSTIESNGFILLGKIKKDSKNNKKTISYVIRDEAVQEELKRIIAKIEFNKNVENPKTILFTGIKEKVGNSYVVANLAYKYAKQGKKVLVIDTNLKKGIQHKIFNVKNEEGLTNLIASKENINIINNYINKSAISNLYVLTQGVERESENLKVEVFRDILQKLQDDFDIILIDGMPILEEVLPIALANIVDATIIVAEYEKTKIKDLLNTKKLIEDINGRISGVIINKV